MDLFLVSHLQALEQKRSAFSRHYFLSLGFSRTVVLSDLLRPTFLRSFPVFGSNSIWINQPLSKAGRDEK